MSRSSSPSPGPLPVPSGVMHVTAALVAREGRWLVARRTRPASLAGLFEFPGGKVERGESAEEALARELREELGIELEVGAFVVRSQGDSGGREIVLDAYRCRWIDGEPDPDPRDAAHDEVQWVDSDDLLALQVRGGLAPLDVPIAVIARRILLHGE